MRLSQSTAASFVSEKHAPDIHPYLEIGKSLQNLRRSVFDMYKDEVTKSGRLSERNSPPIATVHHSSSSSTSHMHELNFESIRTQVHNSSIEQTPSSYPDVSKQAAKQNSGSARTPLFQAQLLQQQNQEDNAHNSKNRASTPYRNTRREYDEDISQIPHFTAADLDDSSDEHSPPARTSRNHRSNSTPPVRLTSGGSHKHTPRSLESKRSQNASYTDELSPHHRYRQTRSHEQGSQVGSDDSSNSSREGRATQNEHAVNASVEVSHAIAVIVGQHEERFSRYCYVEITHNYEL